MNSKPPGVIEQLLAERIGLDPTSVGENLIARGVHVRMAALGVRSKVDYERILMENLDERQALVEEVVVPESWFFRDEKPFEVLTRFAQDWIIGPTRAPLSVLSIPCASGEEPYSIAMTLLEAGLPNDRFRVDAVDVSARSLARAIAGVYGSNAFRGEASARRSSYFREQAGSFTLDLAVRSTVRFHLGNLLDPTLLGDRGPFDVVFCRNLLIYLDDEANARAFNALNRLVVDGGLLFLGHADRLETVESSPFEPMTEKGAFAYRKGAKAGSSRITHPAPSPRPGPSSQAGREAKSKIPSLPPSGPLPPREGGSGWGASRDPGRSNALASNVEHPTVTPHPGPPPQGGREAKTPPDAGPPAQGVKAANKPKPVVSESLLDRASSLADSGQYDEASSLVEQAIAAGLANARAYFLMGMIAQASGLREPAEKHYQKAIYLDPQHDEALFALAILARRKGDVAAEAGYRRRAERVRSRKVNS